VPNEWQPRFLDELASRGLVTRACEAAGIGRRTAYDCRDRDEDFAAAWADALEVAAEAFEAELRRRAIEGVERPVYQSGELVGHIREYSDTLLIFGLKGLKPEKYRDRRAIEHTGPGGGAITIAQLKAAHDAEA